MEELTLPLCQSQVDLRTNVFQKPRPQQSLHTLFNFLNASILHVKNFPSVVNYAWNVVGVLAALLLAVSNMSYPMASVWHMVVNGVKSPVIKENPICVAKHVLVNVLSKIIIAVVSQRISVKPMVAVVDLAVDVQSNDVALLFILMVSLNTTVLGVKWMAVLPVFNIAVCANISV